MAILIKGMQLPNDGRITLQIGSDGAVYIVNEFEITAEKYESNMEAVEVLNYGRLIDPDRLIAFCKKAATESDDKAARLWRFIAAFIELLVSHRSFLPGDLH